MDVLQPYTALAGVCILLAVVILAQARKRPAETALNAYLPRNLLTANELEFWNRLNAAVPELIVLPQVAMSALVDTRRGLKPSVRTAARNRFAQKSCDFVIATRPTLEVLTLIELDDKTHQASKDDRRDAITAAAGYRTLRYLSRGKPSVEKLRGDILAAGSPAPDAAEVAPIADQPAIPAVSEASAFA